MGEARKSRPAGHFINILVTELSPRFKFGIKLVENVPDSYLSGFTTRCVTLHYTKHMKCAWAVRDLMLSADIVRSQMDRFCGCEDQGETANAAPVAVVGCRGILMGRPHRRWFLDLLSHRKVRWWHSE